MPVNAEPTNPPRRKRHRLRWIILWMMAIIFAGAFIVIKWGDSEKMPGFVKVWKLRADVLRNQVKYGRDKNETLEARRRLVRVLLAQGSYKALEKQYRAFLSSDERMKGTNSFS